MSIKRGNTYKLLCKPDNLEDIDKLVFALNDVKKVYNSDGSGDIENDEGTLIVRFTQTETLILSKDEKAKCEIAVKLKDGEVTRSAIKVSNVLDTIIEEEI